MTIVRWWETIGYPMGQAEQPAAGNWYPSVDIYETGTEIVLQVEVPGMTKDQVNVEVDDGTLHLRGERKIEKDVKEESYHRVERVYGTFHRSFALPDTVDPDKVRAELKDGILEIRIGKREQAKPKQIQVSIN